MKEKILRRIRVLIVLFMTGIIISGITAFPLCSELTMAQSMLQNFPGMLNDWISKVQNGVCETEGRYPFIAYGTDWLAFAHIVIAIAFIGPLKDPVRNSWVIDWGMIASILVFPLAFIAGNLRGIPLFHQLIDCSFGVVGFLVLFACRKNIAKLQNITHTYA